MKQILLSLLLVASLGLAACQNSSNEETDTSESISSQQEDTSEAQSESESSPETVEPAYYIDPDIFSVKSFDENDDRKLVLLTFDDAPEDHALDIADTLEAHGARGLFFVNGMYLDDEGAKVVKELHDRGHVIGNHTETHQTLTEASEEKQHDEIVSTNEKVAEITGEPVRFFRAPHGLMTDYAENLLAEEDIQWMNWSFGYDWMENYQDAAALTDVTLNGDGEVKLLAPGANILMHDRSWTAEALDDILNGMEEQGFTVVDPKAITNHPKEQTESVNTDNE